MPRNGSGTYSLPASSWNPAVTGTTIESSAANTTLTDLASALTQSLSKDGQTTPTGNIPMGGFKIVSMADGAASSDAMSYGQGAKLSANNTFTGTNIFSGPVSFTGSAGIGSTLTLVDTDAGASAGPALNLYRNSATPAADDLIGVLQATGKDSGGNTTTYAQMTGQIVSPTDGSEAGGWFWDLIYGGASKSAAKFTYGTMDVYSDDATAVLGPVLRLVRLSATPAANDLLGSVLLTGKDSGGNELTYANVGGLLIDPTNGSEDGGVYFETVSSGSLVVRATVGQGIYMAGATGGDKGPGTINATALYVNGATVGKVVQVVTFETGSVAVGSTVIPLDNSIPQNTEGDQYMVASITPTNAANTLVINVTCNVSHSANSVTRSVALFQDTTANALAAVGEFEIQNSTLSAIPLTHKMTAGTTSPIDFKVRAGASSAGDMTFNGSGGARLFGGVMASTITITEYS